MKTATRMSSSDTELPRAKAELSRIEASSPQRPGELSSDQVALIKRTIAKGCSDDELALFVQTAKRLGLDPFARQIFAVKRWDREAGREVMAIQVSIDGFRLIAERTGRYQGQTAPQWCGDDGMWREVWLENDPPSAARVGIHRDGFVEPLYRVARFASYAQRKKDGSPNRMWSTMPDVMIAKCAEALALRAAFPNDLAGVYSPDEMAQAEDLGPATPSSMREDPEVREQSDHRAKLKDEAKALRDEWEKAGVLQQLEEKWDEKTAESWIRANGQAWNHMADPHRSYVWRRMWKAAERFGWSREDLDDCIFDRVVDSEVEQPTGGVPDEYEGMFMELDEVQTRSELSGWIQDYMDDLRALRALDDVTRKAVWARLCEAAERCKVKPDEVIAWLKSPADMIREAKDADGLLMRVRANAKWIDENPGEAWAVIVGLAATHSCDVQLLEEAAAEGLAGV